MRGHHPDHRHATDVCLSAAGHRHSEREGRAAAHDLVAVVGTERAVGLEHLLLELPLAVGHVLAERDVDGFVPATLIASRNRPYLNGQMFFLRTAAPCCARSAQLSANAEV